MSRNEKTNKDKPYLSYQKWARPWWDHSISFSFSRKAIPHNNGQQKVENKVQNTLLLVRFSVHCQFRSQEVVCVCVQKSIKQNRSLCSVAVHPTDLLYLNCLFFSRALTHSFTLILIHQGTININVIREKDK